MRQRGHATKAIATPSVNASSSDIGLHADIAYTKSNLQKMVATSRQIVVVNHSYGGIVGPGAVESLGYATRAQAGLPGGVIMVVWMAAFVASKGKSLLDLLGGNWAPWMKSKVEEELFYTYMSPEEQQKAIAKLKPQPKKSFQEPALHDSWNEVPSMYIFCDLDGAISLPAQECFAKGLGNAITYRLKASYSSFLRMPEEVIEALETSLKEGRQQSGIL
ncbi:hypothetical protein BDV12DRAFT_210312 [Aspergillus spectabilis]